MKNLILLTLFLGTPVAAFGEVSIRVCEADGNTPFDGREIMVGTKLSTIVYSDVAEDWFYGGSIVIEGAAMQDLGELQGRNCEFGECPGSCLPDAGEQATVWETTYPGIGFDLSNVDDPNAGDWYIIDYEAIDIGDCNVSFYDYDVNEFEPVNILSFHHVPTRDFNGDHIVNYADLDILTSYWLVTDCNEPDWCEGTDLDINHNVNFIDFALFCQFWLERTQ
jgi:hypothetical protein